jgi:hypothetical protein
MHLQGGIETGTSNRTHFRQPPHDQGGAGIRSRMNLYGGCHVITAQVCHSHDVPFSVCTVDIGTFRAGGIHGDPICADRG